jgi:hypothetical protein
MECICERDYLSIAWTELNIAMWKSRDFHTLRSAFLGGYMVGFGLGANMSCSGGFFILRQEGCDSRLVAGFHRCGSVSISGQVTWDMWWTKWHWGGFSQSISVSPTTNYSTFIKQLIANALYSLDTYSAVKSPT